MSSLNNINTDPLVLNEESNHPNGSAQQANGQSVGEHAINAKDSLLNCKVRGRFPRDAPPGLAELQLTPKTSLIALSPRTQSSATHSDSPVAAQSAMAAVNNHPTTQSLKDTVANGEVSLARLP